ncbi:metallophosphoesterase family protein [Methylohalobius crimeensis]|uniref:metallophosphoesterase family protein n=1 Tax=Methylohalobius crimeensis TaxID=244365 RepID=UPI0003B357BF|nr:metallophosphoesterase [Methylohalobius crimeensis]
MTQTFRLAHLSDPHLTSLNSISLRQLRGKRLLGYLSWQLKRRHEHRPEVLEALHRDLKAQDPDHIAVTGDLTQLGLPSEYLQAADWLARLGRPERVTVIPGNHDRYIATRWEESLKFWEPYLLGDHRANPRIFPALRRRGPIDLIGIDSAPPSAPFLATGTLGRTQLESLSALLGRPPDPGRCRILLIHHPPHPEAVKHRKRLTDAAALNDILRQHGSGLILHGHSHYWQLHWLPGPSKPIPVIGIPSASARGRKRGYRARYHLYHLIPRTGGFEIEVEIRGYCTPTGCFHPEGRFRLDVGG